MHHRLTLFDFQLASLFLSGVAAPQAAWNMAGMGIRVAQVSLPYSSSLHDIDYRSGCWDTPSLHVRGSFNDQKGAFPENVVVCNIYLTRSPIVHQRMAPYQRVLLYIDRSLSALLGRSCAVHDEEFVSDVTLSWCPC